MTRSIGPRGLAVPLALLLAAAPLAAQHGEGLGHDMDGHAPDLFADLDEDISVVKKKLMGLAEAMAADAYDWRPGEGVRSVRETLLHVAADNYFIPMALDRAPPADVAISDYASTKAFEMQELDPDQVMAELDRSFTHLRRILGETEAGSAADPVNLFGQPSTVQKTWILTTTHLHEHLGQMIAYARANGVVPPWSM